MSETIVDIARSLRDPKTRSRREAEIRSTMQLAAQVYNDGPLEGIQPVSQLAFDALTGNLQVCKELPEEGEECARLYCNLWEAIRSKDPEAIEKAKNDLLYTICDPGYMQCIRLNNQYFGGDDPKQIPYRPWQNINDFVIDDKLSSNATIAFVGDWGTGVPIVADLLRQVGTYNPDILIHMGDIYYSGTSKQNAKNFHDICREILGRDIPIYTMSGNHDMVSGGEGYYDLLDQLNEEGSGQAASFFGLRNENWQLLAMDTGFNDHLVDDHEPTSIQTSELEWMKDKIANAGGRRTIILSHHPLFSFRRTYPDGGLTVPYNPNLYGQFEDVLSQVDLWLWGHEHIQYIYDPYKGLERGRCIGHGAIPTFTSLTPYTPNEAYSEGVEIPTDIESARLGTRQVVEGVTEYNHGYAIMQLNGQTAQIDYYEYTDSTTRNLLYTDVL